MIKKIFISIILPITSDQLDLAPILNHLWQQPTDFELVVVTPPGMSLAIPSTKIRLVQVESTDLTRGGLLNTGAAAAEGEVLLFLWPDNRLPVEALLTIEKNFTLLSQPAGGNFHLTFDVDTFTTRIAKKFIARERYRGRYFGNSGIFVRRDTFRTLGGFGSLDFLEDYEFARRLENTGPTLYLPDKIVASGEKFGLRAALVWGIVITLKKLGASPPTLARLAHFLGWH